MGVSSNGGTPKWMVNIIIRRAKDRKDNANRAGFWNVMHRFKTENSYATIMMATGRNEDDIAEIDLMAVLHLPHLGRTHQRTTGSFRTFCWNEFQRTPKSCPAKPTCEAKPTHLDPISVEKMQLGVRTTI